MGAWWGAEGTVLITGGTGGLGAVFAKHLVGVHGVRRLVLSSRRGPEAEGVGELVAELAGLGCEARVVACDVGDREQCAALLAGIPAEYPLTGVIHAAGVLEDGTVESLTGDQVRRVLRPKVDGAVNLHELTEEHGALRVRVVLFSSPVVGRRGPGQLRGSERVRGRVGAASPRTGLPGHSLAWGLWGPEAGMAQGVDEAAFELFARQIRERLGMLPLGVELGLELFDAAGRVAEAVAVPASARRRELARTSTVRDAAGPAARPGAGACAGG